MKSRFCPADNFDVASFVVHLLLNDVTNKMFIVLSESHRHDHRSSVIHFSAALSIDPISQNV